MNPIEKYIQNEIDIAKYRIHMLNRLKNLTPAKKRILNIENEFLNISFDSMNFNSVEEASDAINLYRTSRFSFYEKYGCANIHNLSAEFERKLECLLDCRDEFLSSRVEEINLIQDQQFFNKLVLSEVARTGKNEKQVRGDLYDADISELIKIEPANIGKTRARVQVLTLSVGLYLNDELSRVKIPNDSWESYYNGVQHLTKIVDDIKINIFKYYNEAIDKLIFNFNTTMGKNIHADKIHKLQNLLDEYPASGEPIYKISNYNRDIPQLGYILFGIKPAIYQTILKDKEKQTKNRVYGIILPRDRLGFEKLSLLYKNIHYKDLDITNLFSDNLSNVKALNSSGEITYFKSIMLNPLWMIVENISNGHSNFISDVIGYDVNSLCDDIDSKSISTKINTTCTNFINLSRDNSIILVAKTRAEEGKIEDAVRIASDRINDIHLRFTTNDVDIY